MAVKTIIITTTGASTWTVPVDWSSNNTIRVIGGGGGGRTSSGAGGGGGGGGFSSISNVNLSPGTTVYASVGTGGTAGLNGANTWVNISGVNAAPTSTSEGALALGGTGSTSTTGGAGAVTTGAIGTVTFAGGNGGNAASTRGGGGGGSAGSDKGNGFNGGAGSAAGGGGGGGGGGTGGAGQAGQSVAGGTGGVGYTGVAATGGAGGAGGGGSTISAAGSGSPGVAGTEYTVTAGGTAGAGGGGGAGGNGVGGTPNGGLGALYGGGGGGSGSSGTGVGGSGRQGVVIITYTQAPRYWVGGTGTWNNTSTTNWSYSSGGPSGADVPASIDNVIFDANSDVGTGFTVTVSTGAACADFTVSGLDQTMTLSGTTAMTVGGSLSWPSTNFTNSYTGTITFSATSLKTITSGGNIIDSPVTFNGVGGTWSLQDALTIGAIVTPRLVTLTAGTLQLNSYTMTVNGTFNSNNTNTRGINFGTGKLTYFPCASGGESSASPGFDIGTVTTGWTTSGTPVLEITGAIAANNKYIRIPNFTEANSISLRFTASTGAFVNIITGLAWFRDIYYAAGSAASIPTIGNGAITMYGSFTYVSGTLGTGGTVTFAGTTGTQNITSGGATLDCNITFSGTGTYALQDACNIGTATARTITLTTGTLELNSYSITVFGNFSATGTGVRRIQMSGTNGKIVLANPNTVTIWNNATVTNMTTDGNVLVQITNTGSRTISAGAMTEANAVSFQLSPTAGTIIFTASNTVKNLTIDNNAFTVSNIAITIYGNLTIGGTSPTLTAGTNAWTFAGTTGTQTITANGETLDFPITFSGTGTYLLGSALSVGTATARTVTLTTGTLDLSAYTFTIFGVFSSSGTGVRRVQTSTGATKGKIVITTNTAITVFDRTTVTNMTVDPNAFVQLTGGGATVKTISPGSLSTETNSFSFQLSCTAGTVTFSGGVVNSLTVDNTAFTLSNSAMNIYGNFTYAAGSTSTISGGVNNWSFVGSGTQILDTNGRVLDFTIGLSGTGTYSLASNMNVGTSSRTLNLNSGTLELNSSTLTVFGVFGSPTTSTRRIQMSGTGGKIVLSDTGTANFNIASITNLTTDGNVLVQLTGNPATARTITTGALSESSAISFRLSNTTGTTAFAASNSIKDLIIDNNAITLSNTALTLYGNLSFAGISPTLTAGANTWTFAATSSKTITTAGETLDFPIVFDGVGGTWSLQDNLTVGSTRTAALTSGTLDLNGKIMTVGEFDVLGSNAKVLAHGTNGKLTVNGSGTTAFNATGSNLTSTGSGLIDMTSASAKTFIGGGNAYNTLNQGGTGVLTITGSNTFKNISNSVQPATVYFTAGTTSTFTEAFSLSGTSGNVVTISSDTAGVHTLTKTFPTDVNVSFCNISYSTVDAGTWLSLFKNGNTDGGNNTYWIFALGTMLAFFA